MKKIYLLFSLLIGFQLQAQLTLNIQANGSVGISYGSSSDYSLYDPQGDTDVYVYSWVNTDQTNPNLANVYNDDWNDSSGLIVLTYDSNAHAFLGEFNLSTHDFSGEGVLPSNTTVQDFNLILRNQAGDRQSSNLLASTYGFTSVNAIKEISNSNIASYYQGRLTIHYEGRKFKLEAYDLTGKVLIQQMSTSPVIDLSTIQQKMFIVKVIIDNKSYFVKKILQ